MASTKKFKLEEVECAGLNESRGDRQQPLKAQVSYNEKTDEIKEVYCKKYLKKINVEFLV